MRPAPLTPEAEELESPGKGHPVLGVGVLHAALSSCSLIAFGETWEAHNKEASSSL